MPRYRHSFIAEPAARINTVCAAIVSSPTPTTLSFSIMFQEANLLVLVTAAVLAHLTWRLLRNYVTPSPFPNLAGPPSGSLWAG